MKKKKSKRRIKFDESITDYYKYFDLEESLKKEKRQRRLIFISIAAVFYSIISIAIIITFLQKEDFSLFDGKFDKEQITRLTQIEEDLGILNQELNDLKQDLSKDGKDIHLIDLEAKIRDFERKQKTIEETILYDIDKALTTRLLQEKQSLLKEDVNELKGLHVKLNNKMDSILITILAIPLVTFVLGLTGWWIKQKISDTKRIDF